MACGSSNAQPHALAPGHLLRRPLLSGQRAAYLVTLLGIVALAGAVRGGLLLGAAAVGRDAARHYLPQALALSRAELDRAFEPGIPPLYPVLGGLLAWLVGDVELACRLVSLLAGLAAVVLTFQLGRRLFGPWPGLLAAALISFHPYQCRFSADVGPDMLAAALLLAATLSLVGYLQAPASWRAGIVGVMLALLALARPEGFAYAPPTLLVMALFPTGGRWRFEIRRLVHVGVLLGVAVAICLPRLLWVHQETGQWVIDTRQITAPLRLWQAIKERTFQYGQLGLWRRGGFKAFAETLEILAAALGPATLLVGLYAIYRRPTTLRWRIQWIPALAVLFSILLMTISHRLTKRYLLEAGALWQVWGGVGLAMVSAWLFQRLHRRRQRDLQRPDPPALVYIVAACATLVQLPWAMVSLKASHRSERVMGQWILQNLGSGQRIIAPDAIPAWYARGRYIPWPGVRRARRYGRFMRRYIQKTRADLLLLDERYRNRCPEVFADAAARRWPYRAILHRVGDQQRSLSLVAVGPATGEQR